jgi:hypothetical protein
MKPEHEMDDFYPITLRSKTLLSSLYRLDNQIYSMEEEIIDLKERLKESEKRYSLEIDRQIKDGQATMGNVLSAILSRPPISSIGPVGATIMAKIHSMKTIEEVHEYIEAFQEDEITQ